MVHELGCTYLQFDDTSLAYLNDPNQRKMMSERGEDAEHLHEAYIRHINEALADKPEGITITTHMCRGNFRSSWVAEGGYDFVAEALFGELGVDGFFLEYDDARSGGFEPLRFVPKGKLVVLGLVTTKRGELEEQGRAEAAHRGGRASSSTSTSSACRRSAASRPRPRATTSRSTSRSPSCAGSSRSRTRSGVEGGRHDRPGGDGAARTCPRPASPGRAR